MSPQGRHEKGYDLTFFVFFFSTAAERTIKLESIQFRLKRCLHKVDMKKLNSQVPKVRLWIIQKRFGDTIVLCVI